MVENKDRKNEIQELNSETKKLGYADTLFNYYGKEYLTEKGKIIANNRFLTIVCVAQLFMLIVFLFTFYNFYSEREMSIYIPDTGRINISKYNADPLYFQVWGNYILSNIADFNPQNIEDHIKKATKVFDKRSWNYQKPFLEKYQETILANSITQEFKFAENNVVVKGIEGDSTLVTYKGKAIQHLGEIATIERECSYSFVFYFKNGRIFQRSIKTDCLEGDALGKQRKLDESEAKKKEREEAKK